VFPALDNDDRKAILRSQIRDRQSEEARTDDHQVSCL
jgi:hypothetical protein